MIWMERSEKKDGKDQEMEAPYWASAFDSLRYLSPILPSAWSLSHVPYL